MTAAHEYADWVLHPSNARETGRLVKLAAERFRRDLKRDDIYFDESQAVHMPKYCEQYLYHWEGDCQGDRFILELWQRFIFEQIFGWIVTKNGLRRFNEVYVQIAKKNGKSTMCAGLMDHHLTADEKVKTPKIYTAANNQDQAKICVNMAGKILEGSPVFAPLLDDKIIKLMHYGEDIIRVINTENNGFIKAFSKETVDRDSKTAGGKHGVNASMGIVDEFGMSPDHGASGSIKTSMASRRERLMFYITTAGFNMGGPCFQELRKVGIQVLEGSAIKDNYLPMIYEIDPPKEGITVKWLLENEWSWRQANPNIDISVQRDFLKQSLMDAVTYGGSTEVDTMTLNFNCWVDSAEVFIPTDIWNLNSHSNEIDDLDGLPCYGGIEIVGGDYLNAFCLLFPDFNGKTAIKPLFWMPNSFRKNTDTDQWGQWVDDGRITEYLGNVSDNDMVLEMLIEEISRYQMHSFAFKNNLKSNDIVQGFIKQGFEGNPISHGMQGISTPTLKWEQMLRGAEIEHFDNPVMLWMNSNCLAKRRENEVRIEKTGSRQVGIYAAINALAQSMSFTQTEQIIDSW